mmetsp:Transcript_229/g.580  ORF Transcript_229/g.580 Transcript_229/m.580 type:complete len:224 (+) Transcript_229:550-1221(+)
MERDRPSRTPHTFRRSPTGWTSSSPPPGEKGWLGPEASEGAPTCRLPPRRRRRSRSPASRCRPRTRRCRRCSLRRRRFRRRRFHRRLTKTVPPGTTTKDRRGPSSSCGSPSLKRRSLRRTKRSEMNAPSERRRSGTCSKSRGKCRPTSKRSGRGGGTSTSSKSRSVPSKYPTRPSATGSPPFRSEPLQRRSPTSKKWPHTAARYAPSLKEKRRRKMVIGRRRR